MDDECRCCVCHEVVIPEDDDCVVDSDGQFYCEIHSRFVKRVEDAEDD